MIIMLVFLVICLVLLIGQISRANSERDSYANENQSLKEKISRLKGEDPQTQAKLAQKDATISILRIDVEKKEKLEKELTVLKAELRNKEELEFRLSLLQDQVNTDQKLITQLKAMDDISEDYIESLKSSIVTLGKNICLYKQGFGEIHVAISELYSITNLEGLLHIQEISDELYSTCDTSIELVDSIINFDKNVDADDYNNDEFYDDTDDWDDEDNWFDEDDDGDEEEDK
jgi:hypothetical protein